MSKPDWWTPQQIARMDPKVRLKVCTVGGSQIYYGSLNEYDAARLKKGDRVKYAKADGEKGEGAVDFTSFYEGIHVQLEDGGMLWAWKDIIEKI